MRWHGVFFDVGGRRHCQRSLQVIRNALHAAQTTDLRLEALAKIAVALTRMRQKELALQVVQNALQIA